VCCIGWEKQAAQTHLLEYVAVAAVRTLAIQGAKCWHVAFWLACPGPHFSTTWALWGPCDLVHLTIKLGLSTVVINLFHVH
jgi:hypothetical protein